MSAQIQTNFKKLQGIQKLFPILFIAISILVPQSVFASTDALPIGVIEQNSCGSTTVNIYSHAAGMMQSIKPITISNRKVTYTNVNEGCAVVEWRSSNTATSQVIFTELSNEPVQINLTKKNFGYTLATPQNNSGTGKHTAILTNLKPGKLYSYRLVTRSQPTAIPTISDPKVIVVAVQNKTKVITTVSAVVVPVKKVQTKKQPVLKKPATKQQAKKPTVLNSSNSKNISSKTTKTVSENNTDYTKSVYSTSTIPSAIVALNSATKGANGNSISSSDKNQTAGGFSFIKNSNFLSKDNYVVLTLFLLAFLFLIQQLILPAFNINLKKPTLYWIYGSVILTVVASMFALYYVALIGITLFLGLIAWYLLQSVPEKDDVVVNKTTPTNDKAIMKKETLNIKSFLDKK